MTAIAHLQLTEHRNNITEDVKTLVEKYVSMVEWDAPNFDEDVANALILVEMRKALKDIQDSRLKKIID